MANVMQSLFGLNMPTQQAAPAFNPLGNLSAMGAEAGASLRQNIAGAFGQQTPQQALSSIIQQTQQQVDLGTPEGLVQLANNLNQFPQFSGIALSMRQEAAKLGQEQTKFSYDIAAKGAQITESGARTAESQARLAKLEFANTQEENLRTELSNLPPNASEEQILAVYRRYGSADQQSRAIQASLDRRARLAEQNRMLQPELNNNGVPQGRVDAKGNFFDNSGRKVASKEFVDAEQSHNTALDLLSSLRQLTEKDINSAFGSLADYTQSVTGRLAGSTFSSATQAAQYKINRIGVTTILENLQKLKGASTDKEMQKVASTFPGYEAKPDVMKEWVDNAIQVTNNFLRRSERRYGFDTSYEAENRFGTKAKRTPSTKEVPTAPVGSIEIPSGVTVERIR